jgi:transposase
VGYWRRPTPRPRAPAPQGHRGDKGYSSRTARRELRRRGIRPIIPPKKNQRPNPHFDRAAYRERNQIERLFNRLKQFRAIATRYEKLAARFQVLLTIASLLLWR